MIEIHAAQLNAELVFEAMLYYLHFIIFYEKTNFIRNGLHLINHETFLKV